MQVTYIGYSQEDIEMLRTMMSEVFKEEFNKAFSSCQPKKSKSLNERFLTSKQVCELLKISYPTLLKRANEKNIIGKKIGCNWRFPESQFQELFK